MMPNSSRKDNCFLAGVLPFQIRKIFHVPVGVHGSINFGLFAQRRKETRCCDAITKKMRQKKKKRENKKNCMNTEMR